LLFAAVIRWLRLVLLFGHSAGPFFFGCIRQARSKAACVALAGFGNSVVFGQLLRD
jgi:hypothetical protein